MKMMMERRWRRIMKMTALRDQMRRALPVVYSKNLNEFRPK
jgi:hypothetical protein